MARIEQSIEINVPVHTAYNHLTQFEQYPRFVQNVEQVRQLDDTHLHLHTKTGNMNLEWDAEITQQVPDRCIAWRNTSGPKYEGRIELHPTRDDCTRITVTMECDPKQQILAQHGNAEMAIAEHAEHDLVRFKKFIERLGREVGEFEPRLSDAKNSAGAGSGEQVPGETIGKAIAQTASERRDVGGAPSRLDAANEGDESTQAGRPGDMQDQTGQHVQWLSGMFQFWGEPISMMRRISEDMEQFIERFVGRPMIGAHPRAGLAGMRNGAWLPAIEIAQRENQFVVCAELAGVRREDVQVEVRDDRITIEGDRKQEPAREPRETRRSERSYGHFYREIALPPGADATAASAALHDGMLEVTVPVKQGGRRGKRVEIRTPR